MKHLFYRFAFIGIIYLLISSSTIASNLNQKPDFNFPKAVISTADSTLNIAIKAKDNKAIIKSLLQLTIAKNLISVDNFQNMAQYIEETAYKEKDASTQAILYSIAAQLYQEYHKLNGSKINSRKASTTIIPNDVSEWSNNQIQNKILKLINLSLQNSNILKAMSISNFYDVIDYDAIGAILRPTLFDFLAYRNISILNDEVSNTIEKGNELSLCKKDILTNLIDFNRNNNAQYIAARIYEINISRIKSEKKLVQFNELFNKYYNLTPYSGLLLENMGKYYIGSKGQKEVKKYYSQISAFIKDNTDYPLLDNIKTIKSQLEQEMINISSSKYHFSNDSIKINYSISNTNIFEINIYELPENTINSDKVSLSKLKLVAQKKIINSDTIPFFKSSYINIAPLPFGQYIIATSSDSIKNNNQDNHRLAINVTDLFLYSLTSGETTNALAVNFSSGKPEKNITVNYKPNKKSLLPQKAFTNKDGIAKFRNLEWGNLSCTKGTDLYSNSINVWAQYLPQEKSEIKMNLYTDLKVYHPGDSVKYIGIGYYYTSKDKRCAANKQFKIYLRNVNYEIVDSTDLTSDSFGRFKGTFMLPASVLNGEYRIEANSEKDNEETSFNVSEYKAPTFQVKITDSKNNYLADTPIKINGIAQTYAQMPLINDTVTVTLERSEWHPYWRGGYSGEIIGEFKTITDVNGKFDYTFPSNMFSNKDENETDIDDYNPFMQYAVQIKVTSNGGETQSASTYFTIGNYQKLEFLSKDSFEAIEISKPIILPIKLNTNQPTDSISKCIYKITDGKENIIKQGEFTPQKTLIDLTNIPSGEYNIEAKIHNDSTSVIDEDFVFYRTTDKICPVESKMFVPNTTINCDKDNIANILIGNYNTDSYIYHIAYSEDKIISQGWIKYVPGMHNLSIKLPKDIINNVTLNLSCVKDGNQVVEHIQIIPFNKEDSLKIEIASFRDKINSGEKESWAIKFSNSKNKIMEGALIAELYDKALDAIASNQWYFKPQYYYSTLINIQNGNNYSCSARNSSILKFNNVFIKYPILNTYNRNLLPNMIFSPQPILFNGTVRGISTRTKLNEVVVEESSALSKTDKTMPLAAFSTLAITNTENSSNLNNIPLRNNKTKVALWRPDITIGKDGVYKLEFETPNINTTWQFQAIGYTDNMMSTMIRKEIVSTKPIMVHLNTPRFLRHGDITTLIGSLYNSTDTLQNCNSRIEIFNPQTNDVIATNQGMTKIDASSESNISINWEVPDSLCFIGVRIVGKSANYSDGEQVIIPILQSISPVIESQPFVIPADRASFSMNLKNVPNNAKVTFTYCNNPIWYCFSALPSIENNSSITATQISNNIFSLGISQGLVNSNPQIKEALEYWKNHPEDSTMISLLAKNQDLKISSITNNPFLSISKRQTAQMSSLIKLLDEKYIQEKIKGNIENLKSLQDDNGAWKWYNGGNASYYTTTQILKGLGEMRSYEYLKDDTLLTSILKKGIKYCDKEIFNIYNKQSNKNDLSIFCNYFYIRDMYPDSPLSSALVSFKKTSLQKLANDWTKYPLEVKGYIALMMVKNSNTILAKKILESIRQFSSITKNQSMYWDNLDIYSLTGNKEATTALLLQAFNAIEPQSNDINKIRQWLILQKHINDWGNGPIASKIVYSILSTGSNWCQTTSNPIIKINDETLKMNQISKYTGEIKENILLDKESNTLSIQKKDRNPSWGSVMYAYKKDMTKIQASGIEGLSIEKKIFKIEGNKLIESNRLNVGDKVRVQLIIKANHDLDYVTLTDDRAATLEPNNQLSGATQSEGLYYYLELKDNSTNLFFYSIPKGTYLISYDMNVTNKGQYNSGIATIQSQYAPEITAHSAGEFLKVE